MKENVKYSMNDFYEHVVHTFTLSLKLIFNIDKKKHINIISATYNHNTNKYYLEVEYSDKPADEFKININSTH